MLLIVGMIAFLVAVSAVPSKAWAGHPSIERHAVWGFHPKRSTDTMFLLRIVIGAVASLRLAELIVGGLRSASRAADGRRAAARVRRKKAFSKRARDTRLEHQKRADKT